MAVAAAELVLLDAEVVRELEPVAVARQPHEDVDGLVANRQPPSLLEAERLVERHRAVDVRDAVAGVNQLHVSPSSKVTRSLPIRSPLGVNTMRPATAAGSFSQP